VDGRLEEGLVEELPFLDTAVDTAEVVAGLEVRPGLGGGVSGLSGGVSGRVIGGVSGAVETRVVEEEETEQLLILLQDSIELMRLFICR